MRVNYSFQAGINAYGNNILCNHVRFAGKPMIPYEYKDHIFTRRNKDKNIIVSYLYICIDTATELNMLNHIDSYRSNQLLKNSFVRPNFYKGWKWQPLRSFCW